MTFLTTPAPVTLIGRLVELHPLAMSHHDGLVEAAREGDIWQTAWYTSIPAPDAVAAEIGRRLGLADRGEMIPFVAIDASGRVLGMTSYYELVADVPRVHIGYTWNRPSAHGSGTNAESKLLLLRHAFETLGALRVGFTTAGANAQSQAAIERLGAKKDGVMRSMTRYRDGSLRDSVEYSITEPEWPAVRTTLEARVARRG